MATLAAQLGQLQTGVRRAQDLRAEAAAAAEAHEALASSRTEAADLRAEVEGLRTALTAGQAEAAVAAAVAGQLLANQVHNQGHTAFTAVISL